MNPTTALRRAAPDDVPAVVEIHQQAFSDAFLTLLGRRFLAAYYSLLLDYPGAIFVVAEHAGRVRAFAAGCLAPEMFQALLRDQKLPLALAAARGLVRRPLLAPRLLSNYRRTRPTVAVTELNARAPRAELTSLAVDPSAARCGLGGRLVEAFAAEATGRGAAAVELTTDAEGDDSVRRFYERRRFQPVGRFSPYRRRLLVRYRRTLAGCAPSQTEAPKPCPSKRESGLGRVFDFAAAAVGLVLAAPLVVLLALAVKCADGGPCFYRHERVGRYGRRFWMWKLRTMACGADRIGPPLTAGDDPRVTPLGRILRRYKLDEAPQLLNVLTGHMSFVGPRPESPRYVELGDPRWRRVLAVRPGVTDLASLAYRNEEDLLARASDREACYRGRILPAKLALSIEGLERRSRLFDLRLICCTMRYSLFPRGFDSARIRRCFVEDAHA